MKKVWLTGFLSLLFLLGCNGEQAASVNSTEPEKESHIEEAPQKPVPEAPDSDDEDRAAQQDDDEES